MKKKLPSIAEMLADSTSHVNAARRDLIALQYRRDLHRAKLGVGRRISALPLVSQYALPPQKKSRGGAVAPNPENVSGTAEKETVGFRGLIELHAPGAGLEVGRLVDEVSQRLSDVKGMPVRVILEIEADAGDGVGQRIIEAVVANSGQVVFKKMEIDEA